jgi:hypothetical protein
LQVHFSALLASPEQMEAGIGFTSSRAKDPRHSFLSSARFFMLESLLKLIGECIWTVYLWFWDLEVDLFSFSLLT